MAAIEWIQYDEAVRGENHPSGDPDIVNRPLKQLLINSGLDINTNDPAFITTAADVTIQPIVLDYTLNTPPASPADGDKYVVAAGGIDAWTGLDGKIVRWDAAITTWVQYTPSEGWEVYSVAQGYTIRYVSGSWTGTLIYNGLSVIGAEFTVNSPLNYVSMTALGVEMFAGADGMLLQSDDYLDVSAVDYISVYGDGGNVGIDMFSGDLDLFASEDISFTAQENVDIAAWGGYVQIELENGNIQYTATVNPGGTDGTHTFQGHIVPLAPNTYDFGGVGLDWKTAYIGTSVILSASAYIQFGTVAPAQSGLIRLRNNPGTVIALRDDGGGSDQVILSIAGASNNVTIGNTSELNSIILSTTGNSTTLDAAGNIYPSNVVATLGTSTLRWNGLFIRTHITIYDNGAGTPASAGAVRMANNTSLNWRNAGNTADIGGVQVFTDNKLYLGQLSAGVVSGATFTPQANNSYDVGSTSFTWRAGYFGTNVIVGTDGAAAKGASEIVRIEGTGTGLGLTRYANESTVRMRRAEGSSGSETALANGNVLGRFRWAGYNGTAYVDAATISAQASQAYTGSVNGTRLIFQVTLQSTTGLTSVAQVDENGTLSPVTTASYDLGTSSLVWRAGYIASVVSPLFGTTTAVDVVIQRNSVTQLTIGSLLATFAGSVVIGTDPGGSDVFRAGGRITVQGIRVNGSTQISRDIGTGSLVFSGGSGTTNGGNVLFYGGSHATQANDIELRSGANVRGWWDDSAGLWEFSNAASILVRFSTPAAGEVALWVYDADNTTLERVTVGAADSGGAGYKVLRIPN